MRSGDSHNSRAMVHGSTGEDGAAGMILQARWTGRDNATAARRAGGAIDMSPTSHR